MWLKFEASQWQPQDLNPGIEGFKSEFIAAWHQWASRHRWALCQRDLINVDNTPA